MTDFQENVEMDAMLLLSCLGTCGQFGRMADAWGLTNDEDRVARSHWFNQRPRGLPRGGAGAAI